MHRVPATFYTKVLAPEQPTTTNKQSREQSSQLSLTRYMHKAELKLFGHVLRAPETFLERNSCFTKSFLYRGRVVVSGIRRCKLRIHRANRG